MASMRRASSSQIRESRATTTATTVSCKLDFSTPVASSSSSSLSSSPSSSSSLRAVVMAMAMETGHGGGKGTPKMRSWKKLLIQFGMCFAIGLVAGWWTPQQWQLYSPESVAGEGEAFSGMSTMGEAFAETKISAEMGNAFAGGVGADVAMEMPPLEPRKLLILVTPTYTRPFKAYYLTRLAHTLKLVPPPLLWLVVEMQSQSLETATLLRETGLMYRHLVCDRNFTNVKDRGTHQRNTALAHIEQHQLDGIVYFADDDNVYTLELFQQMRHVQRFGTWLVGMLAPGKSRAILEGPVCRDEKVVGWHTNAKSKRLRRFHVDMSGFAFNSTILWDPRRWKRPTLEPIRQLDSIKEGFQETTFIEQLVPDESYMEGRPPGCLKVMVWHLHLEAPKGFAYPSGWTLTAPLQANIPVRTDK